MTIKTVGLVGQDCRLASEARRDGRVTGRTIRRKCRVCYRGRFVAPPPCKHSSLPHVTGRWLIVSHQRCTRKGNGRSVSRVLSMPMRSHRMTFTETLGIDGRVRYPLYPDPCWSCIILRDLLIKQPCTRIVGWSLWPRWRNVQAWIANPRVAARSSPTA